VARPRSWLDFAALAFALTVLTGLHTFAGMMREAYPVNHYLLVALYCLAVLALAHTRGGLLVDLAAVTCLVLGMLVVESGLLVWVVAAASYWAGRRGLSRGALVSMTTVVVLYAALRIGYLDVSPPSLGERATGFGTAMLTSEQQVERFGETPWVLYVYTVASAVLSVLFSQPMLGQWTAIAAWQNGQFDPVYGIEITTSVAATALIVWFLFGRTHALAPRRWREPLGFVVLAVLAANGAMSYLYAKDEIVSVAGVFYALLAFASAAAALEHASQHATRRIGVTAVACAVVVGAAWGFRSIGLHYKLRRSSFDARMEWVLRTPPYGPEIAEDPSTRALEAALKQQALTRPVPDPAMLPRWAGRYWGDH